MKPDADIAIVGAGCAGLSLASALAEARVPGSVLLLEPREEYTRDRTWCFWDTEPHPFTSAISDRWPQWRVSSGEHTVLRGSASYHYCHLPADAFYRLALDRVARQPDWQLCRAASVRSVEAVDGGLLAVETNCGRVLARRVFDSRPPACAPVGGLLQRFLGRHVRAAKPCFDPQTVDLMRFLPSSVPGRVRFLYILPFTPEEALVEMTYLDDPALPDPPYAEELQAWLEEHVGAYDTPYTERGSLPMGGALAQGTLPANAHRIGIAGGRLKPSSGYGFLRIQRHSRAIAQALQAGRAIPSAAEPNLYNLLASVVLRALRARPEAAPQLFLRMFEHADPDALVRFLSERSRGWGEIAGVAWSLPKTPMLRAAAGAAWTGA